MEKLEKNICYLFLSGAVALCYNLFLPFCFSERANASLHDLEDVLTHSPNATLNTSARAKEQLTAAVHPRTLRWYEGEARPQKYRDAVSSLQNLLQDQDPKVFALLLLFYLLRAVEIPCPTCPFPWGQVRNFHLLVLGQAKLWNISRLWNIRIFSLFL